LPATITRIRATTFSLGLALLLANAVARADPGEVTPRPLIDFAAPTANAQIAPYKALPANSQITVDPTGITVNFPPHQPGDADHPGFAVIPAPGNSWDLSAFGHIEAKVLNAGVKVLPFVMQVEDGSGGLNNLETMNVNPGETKVVFVYFGYQYGFQPGAPINTASIKSVNIFMWGSPDPHAFRIEELSAGGAPGEKPRLDPNAQTYKPENGVMIGPGVAFDLVKQVRADGPQVSMTADGTLAVSFSGGKTETVTIKPAIGIWNWTAGTELRVKFKNTGKTAVTPGVAIGPAPVFAPGPILPGAIGEVVASFVPTVSAVGDAELGRNTGPKPGTGATFENDNVKGFSVLSDATPGPKSLLVTSAVIDAPPEDVPDWVGTKPPVPGDWVQTLDEEFNEPAPDFHRWNIYGTNRIPLNRIWNRSHDMNRAAHFSRDNVILGGGHAILRFAKQTGNNNDAQTGPKSDYATGYLTTRGKWTQRYGYFEARVRLPAAPGLWTGFYLLPDRGKAIVPAANRFSTDKISTDTGVGGMEFDLVDAVSATGVYRFNVGMQVGDYGSNHKLAHSQNTYVRADKDGYLTIGLLWTPGLAVVYNHGQEIFRLENARVGDVPCSLQFFQVIGGPNNSIVDDAELPADFTINYVRAWQRKDLASPADGPEANSGDPDENKN